MHDPGNEQLPATFRHAAGFAAQALAGHSGARLLDVGCGDGRLLAALARALPGLDCQGLDVVDHGLQAPGFLARAVQTLNQAVPGTDWGQRIHAVTTGEAWPVKDASINLLLTNQVLEHVADLDFLFREQARVLTPDGVALHIFPAREIFIEPHYFVPAAHRFPEGAWRRGWLKLWAYLGAGDYGGKGARGLLENLALADQSLTRQVAYRSYSEIAAIARRAGFLPDWSATPGLYAAKAEGLGQIARHLPLFVLARLSSLTLICRRP